VLSSIGSEDFKFKSQEAVSILAMRSKNVELGAKCYLVMHRQGRQGDENVKTIGIFPTLKYAKEVVARLRLQPGFDKFGRFYITKMQIGDVEWAEGFVKSTDESLYK
jgi:hypothetical protein